MHAHAYILIWDAHTHMEHGIVLYAYGTSYIIMYMGRYTHMGQNTDSKHALFLSNCNRYSLVSPMRGPMAEIRNLNEAIIYMNSCDVAISHWSHESKFI